MLKALSIAVVALSFTLAPVAKAEDTTMTKTVKTEKVESTADSKEMKAGKKAGVKEGECENCKKKEHDGKDCACKDKKDCKCSKEDCKSGACKDKKSKKYCKHCAEHKDHDHAGEKPAEKPAEQPAH